MVNISKGGFYHLIFHNLLLICKADLNQSSQITLNGIEGYVKYMIIIKE